MTIGYGPPPGSEEGQQQNDIDPNHSSSDQQDIDTNQAQQIETNSSLKPEVD